MFKLCQSKCISCALFVSKFNLLVVFAYDLRFSISILVSFYSSATVVLFRSDVRVLKFVICPFNMFNIRFLVPPQGAHTLAE